jgi:hypothetical protein
VGQLRYKKDEIKEAVRAAAYGKRISPDFERLFDEAFEELLRCEERICTSCFDVEFSSALRNLMWLHNNYGDAKINVDNEVTLYRARLFDGTYEKNLPPFFGYDKSGSFVPPRKFCKSGRANYEHRPCLYATEDLKTAILETKPAAGQIVSVATIKLAEPLLIFNLYKMHILASITQDFVKKPLMTVALLGFLFSEPTSDHDNPDEYIVTQYLSEYIQQLPSFCRMYAKDALELFRSIDSKPFDVRGNPYWENKYKRWIIQYDGITYKSQFTGKKNYCIFNYNKCEPISSSLYKVEQGEIVRCNL